MTDFERALLHHLREHRIQHPGTQLNVTTFIAGKGIRIADLNISMRHLHKKNAIHGWHEGLEKAAHDQRGLGIIYDGSGLDFILMITPEGENMLLEEERVTAALRFGKREWAMIIAVAILSLVSTAATVWQLCITIADRP